MATNSSVSFESGESFGKTFGAAVIVQFSTLITAAFSFIAGLAINDAIQTGINQRFPDDKRKALKAKIAYAGIVVVILVVIMVLLTLVTATVLLLINQPSASSSNSVSS